MAEAETEIVPDSERRGLIGALPAATRPYASLIRLDRPIGAWLLFWPGAWSVALAGNAGGIASPRGWALIAWLALGAWAMRSAGCVYNDIVDRDLDRKVARTRLRPLASGRVSLKGAWALLVAMSLIGLVVLLQLDRLAQANHLVPGSTRSQPCPHAVVQGDHPRHEAGQLRRQHEVVADPM